MNIIIVLEVQEDQSINFLFNNYRLLNNNNI